MSSEIHKDQKSMGKGEQMNQGDERKTEQVPNGSPEGPASEVKEVAGSGKAETPANTEQQDKATKVATEGEGKDATESEKPETATTNGQPDAATLATPSTDGLSTVQKAGVQTIADATDQLYNADAGKPEEMAAATNKQLLGYYIDGLRQSTSSFWAALVVAILGVVLFAGAVLFLLLTNNALDVAVVSAIGGAIVEVIAGLVFYIYGKTTDQLDGYRKSMEQTQRFLLANSIALSLKDMQEPQQKTVATLVNTISQWGRPGSKSRDNDDALSGAARRLSSRNKDAGESNR